MHWLEAILKFDTEIFLILNRINSPWWDTAMLLFTRKETFLLFYLMLAFAIIRNYERKSWIILLVLLLGFVASDQISTLVKDLTQRLRPGHEPALEGLVHIVLRKGGLYGFVSSHASNAFYILTFTALLFRNRLSFISILAWAFIISYSRIYNGNHYPLDIIGGWILGFGLGILFYKLLIFIETRFFVSRPPRFEKTRLKPLNAGLIFMTTTTIIATVLIVVELLHKYPTYPL